MQAPASTQPASDTRTCNSCGATVHRADVHKNRLGQYICKECRSSGVRAAGRHRLRHLYQRMPTALAVFLVVLLVVVLLPLAFLVLAQLHTYSNTSMVDDLKDLVRSINRLAH